jgi:hypothetical protein
MIQKEIWMRGIVRASMKRRQKSSYTVMRQDTETRRIPHETCNDNIMDTAHSYFERQGSRAVETRTRHFLGG